MGGIMERWKDNVRYEHERVNTKGRRALEERGTKRWESKGINQN